MHCGSAWKRHPLDGRLAPLAAFGRASRFPRSGRYAKHWGIGRAADACRRDANPSAGLVARTASRQKQTTSKPRDRARINGQPQLFSSL